MFAAGGRRAPTRPPWPPLPGRPPPPRRPPSPARRAAARGLVGRARAPRRVGAALGVEREPRLDGLGEARVELDEERRRRLRVDRDGRRERHEVGRALEHRVVPHGPRRRVAQLDRLARGRAERRGEVDHRLGDELRQQLVEVEREQHGARRAQALVQRRVRLVRALRGQEVEPQVAHRRPPWRGCSRGVGVLELLRAVMGV